LINVSCLLRGFDDDDDDDDDDGGGGGGGGDVVRGENPA
jgi:hypothetical protein